MIPTIDWSSVFKIKYPATRAFENELTVAQAKLFAPLSDEEIAAVARTQVNPFDRGDPLYSFYRPFDATLWQLPKGPLPEAYLDFLRWSNGGSFFNDERRFDAFMSCSDIRRYLVAYNIPGLMPFAVPFATTGNGHIYLFDMRQPPSSGEYPILLAGFGAMSYDLSFEVGRYFLEVCSGTTDPVDEWEDVIRRSNERT